MMMALPSIEQGDPGASISLESMQSTTQVCQETFLAEDLEGLLRQELPLLSPLSSNVNIKPAETALAIPANPQAPGINGPIPLETLLNKDESLVEMSLSIESQIVLAEELSSDMANGSERAAGSTVHVIYAQPTEIKTRLAEESTTPPCGD